MSAAARLAALLVAMLALVPGPAAAAPGDPPHAADRWARVAAELAKDPLFVDPDLAGALDDADRARLRKAMAGTARRIGVPVYVVVIPNPLGSESQGRAEPFLFGLRERLGRDGLYLTSNEYGRIDAVPFGVPRELSRVQTVPSELRLPPDYRTPLARLTDRLNIVLGRVAAAPPGPTTTPRPVETVAPFGQERPPPREAAFWAPFLTGLLVLGPLAAVVLYGLYASFPLVAGVLRRRVPGLPGPRDRSWPKGPTRPSVRWLRARAAEELGRLRALLPPGDDEPGRAYALRAYDAAQILFDDLDPRPAKKDAAAVLDLVGVVVLARQGQAVLAGRTARPAAPCFVNPLDGPSTKRRKVGAQGTRPVCAACATAPEPALTRLMLTVPDGRPHHAVPGRWKRAGFGSRRPDLASDVLESLGVD
ncbi:hypothetical protein DPM19_26025 [Actinomadura craniellae]|uniref:TPM domain-containing protein n=1 Tax=Actinomadura craniellae TaxID=2231787 RepID=A0A365H1U9_9ACTN|nr:hypothetical protein [Actinomadura craniellae]RAY12183.1 hypothetical protein DPM19_26025 [Actinomadura craniellae]